jgi:hypothetical protein
MERKNIFKVFIGVIIFSYIFNNFFTEGMITGVYISNNNQSILEGPNRIGEKLFLLEDNKFKSDTWGNGTYELKYTFKGTRIDLTYNYEFGKAGYETSINRGYFIGKPQIILDRDLEFYFQKIE